MRTSNPALNSKTFDRFGTQGDIAQGVMTVGGTVNKTAILLLIALATAFYVWRMFFISRNPGSVAPWMLVGAIGGLIVAIVTAFKKQWAPATAPLYAALEGLFLGGISAFYEARYPGIVIQAVALTFGTAFALLMAYKSRLIRATENFKLGVVAATGGIFLLYLASMVLGFFGISIGFIHNSGPLGIIFSIVVVVIAALNLVLDFDFIEHGAEQGAPKFMEWYGAFGLMVTLVWLYLEILRLLGKLRSRR
ncbi:MAG TPA: Bax inhibitor-1/YccA family protein [Acidobacteriota bacterium]|nr:Bax inhibitor-1/YccA family protein [Acidobacteriota bacterium]